MTASVEKAEASPVLIAGVIAWKVIAFVVGGIVVGVLLDRAAHRGGSVGSCPVHRRANGTTFTRASCT